MKIKKFYYYSPDKLKLIPIEKFFPKLIAFLVFLFLTISISTAIITKKYMAGESNATLQNQNSILEAKYAEDIEQLRNKYSNLVKKVNRLSQANKDIRLAVNLEPYEIDESKFGIGGSVFENHTPSSILKQNGKLDEIYNCISDLELKLSFETTNFSDITNKYEENIELFSQIPAIRPVNSSIGDRYGIRFHPILKRKRMHHGLDFLSNVGEPVFAPGDGVITYVGKRGGYGKVIRINHGFGYETLYAHLSKYKVKKGQKVKRGEIIALTGNSGSLSTGPHLHYEVRHNGRSLNPKNLIFEETKLFESHSN